MNQHIKRVQGATLALTFGSLLQSQPDTRCDGLQTIHQLFRAGKPPRRFAVGAEVWIFLAAILVARMNLHSRYFDSWVGKRWCKRELAPLAKRIPDTRNHIGADTSTTAVGRVK